MAFNIENDHFTLLRIIVILLCLNASYFMNKPITILKRSTLSDTIRKLIDHKISRLIVQEYGKPLGIITEKDIGFFLWKEYSLRSLDQIFVEEIMKKIVFMPSPADIKECATTMIQKDIGSIVLGSNEKLEGILTKTDVIRYFSEYCRGIAKVVQIKNPGFVSVSTETPLSEVIEIMLKNRISRVIVSNTEGKPIGIITFRDFFEISLQLGSEEDIIESAALSGRLRIGFLSEKGFGGVSIARDVMTPKIISISPDVDLAQACKVMLDNKVNGLIVVVNEGKIGIVSKTDVVRFFSLLD